MAWTPLILRQYIAKLLFNKRSSRTWKEGQIFTGRGHCFDHMQGKCLTKLILTCWGLYYVHNQADKCAWVETQWPISGFALPVVTVELRACMETEKGIQAPFFFHSCFCLNLCLIAMEKRGAIRLWPIMFCVVYVFLQWVLVVMRVFT